MLQRKVTNLPEAILVAEVTERGRIEHQFLVYGAVVVLFIQVKKELLTGKAKLDQVAQVLAEADSSFPFLLHRNGVLLMLTRFTQLVITAILPSAYRSRLMASSVMAGILNSSYTTRAPGSLRSLSKFQGYSSTLSATSNSYVPSSEVRDISPPEHPRTDSRILAAEYMYDFFLAGYVNGPRAFLSKSTTLATRTATKRLSTDRWVSALKTAEDALAQARCATRMASASGGRDPAAAEVMAVEALRLLNRSVEEAPDKPKEIPSYMDSWNDREMQVIE